MLLSYFESKKSFLKINSIYCLLGFDFLGFFSGNETLLLALQRSDSHKKKKAAVLEIMNVKEN